MKELNGFVLSDDLSTLFEYKGTSKDVVLPDGIKEIMDYAFMDKELVSVRLNDDLERIENKAFQGNFIEEIIIPRNVYSIGSCAFNCCYELRKVTILNPMISMYTDSFDHCYELEEIYFDGTKEEWEKTIYNEDDGSLLIGSDVVIRFK